MIVAAQSVTLAAAAGVGAVIGWGVTVMVRRLAAEPGGPAASGDHVTRGLVVAGVSAASAALWWWEVEARGQLPWAHGMDSQAALAWRWAGHVILLGFLCAATWIDVRERVIPDGITLPGVLAGLTWAAVRPQSLLPIVHEVDRDVAAPLRERDVLGLAGPIGGAQLPAWLEAAPGLGVGMGLFLAWWWFCTAPEEANRAGRGPLDPRPVVLVVGLAGITAAWWRGGGHWAALLSALVGMATGVALVWATRIGASRALGREALGFGDVTLMAVIGAWLGWQGTVLTCCLGVLVGLGHGLIQLARARGNELPFGPSLCAGAVLVVVLWKPLWERVGPVFERPHEIAIVAVAVVVMTALTLAVWWRFRGVSAR